MVNEVSTGVLEEKSMSVTYGDFPEIQAGIGEGQIISVLQ